MDLLRRKTGESLEESGCHLTASEPDALSVAMAFERTTIFASEMAGLAAPYREVLTLRFEEGMKLEEIAEVTHSPLSTVKSRVQRALETLRQKMTARYRKEDLI